MPTMSPEEITNISIADKVASLSPKPDLYDGAIAEIRCENVKLESRVSSIEKHKENKANNNSRPSIISSLTPAPSSRLTVHSSPVPVAARRELCGRR